MTTPTSALARNVLALRWADLSAAVREAAVAVVYDAVPVMAAGAQEEPARLVRDFAAALGGPAECTVIGGGFTTSAPLAAFTNGVACHVLDYEPMWHPPTHPTSPVLPVALALVERDGINGLQLHPPGVVGVMGAAAAAAWLLGLTEEQACMAFGIAGSRAGGLMANLGTMTKSTHSGMAGRLGLESALLAASGFTAHADILSTRSGFAEVFLKSEGELAAIIDDFGRPFRLVDPGVAIKKYPCQYGTQRAIDAALEISRARPLPEAEIAAVTVTGPHLVYVERPRPISGLDGKFSFQYVTAVALLDGTVGIDSFSDARRWSSDVEALLPRISYVPRDDVPPNFDGMWIRTMVDLKDGRQLTGECIRPTGIWGLPLSAAERETKARDCLKRVLPAQEIPDVLQTLRGFGDCSAEGIRGLLAALRPG